MAAVDDEKGIRLVVDLTMYTANTRDMPSKQVADLSTSQASDATISEQLATSRRRKEQ